MHARHNALPMYIAVSLLSVGYSASDK